MILAILEIGAVLYNFKQWFERAVLVIHVDNNAFIKDCDMVKVSEKNVHTRPLCQTKSGSFSDDIESQTLISRTTSLVTGFNPIFRAETLRLPCLLDQNFSLEGRKELFEGL